MAFKSRSCGCKGCRTCLICESLYGATPKIYNFSNNNTYVYCPYCNKAYPGWDFESFQSHPNHLGEPVNFPGVFILENFITAEEEKFLLKNMDEIPWDISQSGRRKQNFGPKTNFKKRKIALGNFNGYPKFSMFLQERFDSIPLLRNYQTIEQCSLEYNPENGASIDPHIDDCWIWGERIVTVNLLSDSVLTMNRYKGEIKRYNLKDSQTYKPIVHVENADFISPKNLNMFEYSLPTTVDSNIVVRIPMPKRSLLVLYGEARYHWEHSVLREDIKERRVCLAYREFTPPYLKSGEHADIGDAVRERAKIFYDHLCK